MNPFVAGSLVTAGGSLLNGLFGGLFSSSSAKSAAKAQLQATRETNAQNYEIWHEQRQHAMNMWKMENEYNSPINQRQRLVDAGYNPYLAYGEVGNTAGSVNIPSAPSMVAPDSSAFPNTGELFAQHMNMGIANALQSLATISQVANTNQDTKNKSLDYLFNKETFGMRKLGIDWDNAFKYWQNENSYWDYQNKKFDNELKNETKGLQIDILKNQRDQIKLQNINASLDARTKSILNQYLPAEKQMELAISAQQWYKLYRDGLLSEEQLRTQIAQTALVWANVTGQNLKNDAQALENKFNAETFDDRKEMISTELDIKKLDYRKANAIADNYIKAMNAQYYKDYWYNRDEGEYFQKRVKMGHSGLRYAQDVAKGFTDIIKW